MMPNYAIKEGFNPGGGFSEGAGQIVNGLLNNPSAPYDAARNAYQPYLKQSVEAQNPFFKAGTEAIPKYQDWTNNMSNPSDFINKLMSQYQQSPWAKFQKEQGSRELNNAASANGLTGSTPLSQFQSNYAHDISQQDMSNWLEKVLGINTSYGQNVQHQVDTGQTAGANLSNIFSRGGESMGNLAFGQENSNQQNNADMINGLMKFLPLLFM